MNKIHSNFNTNNVELDESKCSCTHDKDEKTQAILELDKRILSYILHNYDDSSYRRKKTDIDFDKKEVKASWMEFYLNIFFDKNNQNKTREKLFRINFIINQACKYNSKNISNNIGIYFENAPKKLIMNSILLDNKKLIEEDDETEVNIKVKNLAYEEENVEYHNILTADKHTIVNHFIKTDLTNKIAPHSYDPLNSLFAMQKKCSKLQKQSASSKK